MTREELEIAIKKAKAKDEDLVISVDTESEFNELMTKCKKLDMCTLRNSYDFYKRQCEENEKLCVRIVCIGSFYYSGENWYKENGFKIVPFNKKDETIVIYRKGDDVIATNKATGKQAKATCSKDDEFVFETGAKLAFERLLGGEPKGVREVHRMAKKGEYVKVVDVGANGASIPKTNDEPEYRNGDILKIIKEGTFGVVYYAEGNAGNGVLRGLTQREYVVLEGYEPPKEEKPRGIQVGDTVRVINNSVSYITYIDFFKKHNIDKLLEHYAYGHKPEYGFTGKVVYISGLMVVIKEDNIYGCGKIYLIDKRGLEKV